MRLSQKEIKAIKEVFKNVFNDAELYLFGSRLDDTKRGGDIDLFIKNRDRKIPLEKKLDFLVKLKQKIGDQKIDVIVSNGSKDFIEDEAVTKGIKLCEI